MLRTFIVVTGYIRRSGREWPLFSPIDFKAATPADMRLLMRMHRVTGEAMEVIDMVECWANEIDPQIDN